MPAESVYDADYDDFGEVVDGVTDVGANLLNPPFRAIEAIQHRLGLYPSGPYATVADRITALETYAQSL